jgi:hypothetical protein
MIEPISKLKRRIRQLEGARACWKSRCARKQDQIRYLRVKARDLALSRDRWKALAGSPTVLDAPDAPVVLPLPAPAENSVLGEA